MWPGSPSGVPGRTAIWRSARPATTSASSASPRSIQEKLAWVSAVREAELAQALLDPQALGDRALDPRGDVVLVQDRLRPRRLGEGVDAEGLAHGVDRGAELGRAERVADPQAGEAVALAEGAQDDQVGQVGEQVDAGVEVVVGLELDVGLVEDHGDVGRQARAEGGHLGGGDVGAGRVVRVADEDAAGSPRSPRPPSRRGRGRRPRPAARGPRGRRSAPAGTGTSRRPARRRGSRRRARRAPRRRRAGSRRSRCRRRPGPGRCRSARRCGGAAASRRGPGSGSSPRPRRRSPRPPSGAAARATRWRRAGRCRPRRSPPAPARSARRPGSPACGRASRRR